MVDNKYDMYLNPSTMKKMKPNIRAISTDKGDLFIYDDGGMTKTHGDVADNLKRHGYLKYSGNFGNLIDQLKFVTWQRDGNSNTFKLSTSFPELETLSDDEHKVLDKLINNVAHKNPQYKFIKKMIWENKK